MQTNKTFYYFLRVGEDKEANSRAIKKHVEIEDINKQGLWNVDSDLLRHTSVL